MQTSLTQEIMQELRQDVLTDRDTCNRLSEDFLQLMRTPQEDFRHIKEQTWYKRLWSTFGGQNLQRVASGLYSLAQAQTLLKELVITMARNHSDGIRLIEPVIEDLERTKLRQGGLQGHISTIYDEISSLKHQLQYQKTMVLDENELPEEIRILILRAMIAIAHVDKDVDPAETEVICKKIDSMELSEKARRIILSELSAPTPLKMELRLLDSHKVRFLLYRNIAAVAAADGKIHVKEHMLLDRLAKAFGIQDQDARSVQEELMHLKSVEGLEMMIASVVNTLNKKEAEDLAKAQAEQEEEQARQFELIVNELAESWMALVGKLATFGCRIIQAPLLARLDGYNATGEIVEALDFLNEPAIRKETNESGERFCGWLNQSMDQTLIRAFPFMESGEKSMWSKSVGNKLSAEIANELSTGLRPLVQLTQAEARVRKCDQGALSVIAEAGVAGFGLGVLTGGLGILAGAAYGWWKGKQREEEAAAALETYVTNLKTFADTFDGSVERISEKICNVGGEYFDRLLIPYLDEANTEYHSLQCFQEIILREHAAIDQPGDSCVYPNFVLVNHS
jgi:uncharacterized membrane protein YebE (DUF533 family)